MSKQVEEFNFSMGGKSNARGWHNHDGYESGSVATPYGFVDVYVQGDERNTDATVLDFCHGNRHYVRTYRERFTRRYCVTLAHRFAANIVGTHKR